MSKNKTVIFKLTLGAMLSALSVILNLVFDLWLNINTFGFPFYGIPLILAGLFLGPKYGFLVALASDTVFGLIKGYYPWFVFSTIAWATIPVLLRPKGNKIYWTFVIVLTYLSATLANTFAMRMNFSRNLALANFWLRVGLIPPFSIIIGVVSYILYVRLRDLLPQELIKPPKKKGLVIPEYLTSLKELKLVKYD